MLFDTYHKLDWPKDYKPLDLERIDGLMSMGSVDNIFGRYLQDSKIERLVYDPKNPEESVKEYNRFVFQKDLESLAIKPTLVMFSLEGKETELPNMRDAIIFKEIKTICEDKINLLSLTILGKECNEDDYKKISDSLRVSIRGLPSIAMYGKFDLLKGETPKSNDGKIKHLDTLFGSPATNEDTISWIYKGVHSISGWIKSNLIRPNGEYAVRINNSKPINPIKVAYKLELGWRLIPWV